jgi:hypothetical protein
MSWPCMGSGERVCVRSPNVMECESASAAHLSLAGAREPLGACEVSNRLNSGSISAFRECRDSTPLGCAPREKKEPCQTVRDLTGPQVRGSCKGGTASRPPLPERPPSRSHIGETGLQVLDPAAKSAVIGRSWRTRSREDERPELGFRNRRSAKFAALFRGFGGVFHDQRKSDSPRSAVEPFPCIPWTQAGDMERVDGAAPPPNEVVPRRRLLHPQRIQFSRKPMQC